MRHRGAPKAPVAGQNDRRRRRPPPPPPPPPPPTPPTPPPKHTLAHGSNTLCVRCRGSAGRPGRLPQPYPHAWSPSSPSRQASLSCRSRGRVGLEPHPPHTAATPTAAKAGLHSPRHDHLAGQSRVKTPPPRSLPRSEVAVGMSYSLLLPPSEPTFSQTGSLGNVGGNRIPAMAHANRTTFGQAPECTTCRVMYRDLTTPCGPCQAAALCAGADNLKRRARWAR